jgi:hypothetical protein
MGLVGWWTMEDRLNSRYARDVTEGRFPNALEGLPPRIHYIAAERLGEQTTPPPTPGTARGKRVCGAQACGWPPQRGANDKSVSLS